MAAGKYNHLNKQELLELMSSRGYTNLEWYEKFTLQTLRSDLEYDDTFKAVANQSRIAANERAS